MALDNDAIICSWPSSIVSLRLFIYRKVAARIDRLGVGPRRVVAHNAQPAAMPPPARRWAFVAEKHRFFLFGTYPADALATRFGHCQLARTVRRQCMPAGRRLNLFLLWLVALVFIGILMWGGVFGLAYVENERWGGLL